MKDHFSIEKIARKTKKHKARYKTRVLFCSNSGILLTSPVSDNFSTKRLILSVSNG